MSATNRCPVCDSEIAPEVMPSQDCEEAVCVSCAASYASLMAEITEKAPRALDAPAAPAQEFSGVPLMVVEEFGDAQKGSEVAAPAEGNFAVGVNLHRVPAGTLVLVSAFLFGAIMLAGWYRFGDGSQASAVAGEKQPAVVEHEPLWNSSEPASKPQSEPAAQQLPAVALDIAQAAPEASREPAPAAEEHDAAEEEADVEEVEPAAPAPAVAVAHDADGGRFTIQAGSYNLAPEADDRAAALRAAGFDARVVSAVLPGKGTWYRVQCGRFGTREEALRYGQHMKSSGAVATTFVADIKN